MKFMFRLVTVVVTGIGLLAAGTYTIRARLVRSSTGNGNVSTNAGNIGYAVNCNDVPIIRGQLKYRSGARKGYVSAA